MYPWHSNNVKEVDVESGFALIVTLLLLLVLMLMASGIAHQGSSYVDLSNSVSYKAQSINAAETCADEVIDWLKTDEGQSWVTNTTACDPGASSCPLSEKDMVDPLNGPLYQKNLLTDTVPSGATDTRSNEFKNMASRVVFKKCYIRKIFAPTLGPGVGSGSDIGKDTNTSYTVFILADGNFNVQYNSDGTINSHYWNSSSSKTVLEIILDYISIS